MRLLALDISTKVGWAIDHPKGGPGDRPRPLTGVEEIGSKLVVGRTLWRLSDWLYRMQEAYRPEAMAVEAPIFSNANNHLRERKVQMNPETVTILIGGSALVQVHCYTNEIPCYIGNVQSVRRHFLGHGRPPDPKKAVMRRCDKLGWAYQDNNAADAAALWDWAKSLHDKGYDGAATTPLFDGAAG